MDKLPQQAIYFTFPTYPHTTYTTKTGRRFTASPLQYIYPSVHHALQVKTQELYSRSMRMKREKVGGGVDSWLTQSTAYYYYLTWKTRKPKQKNNFPVHAACMLLD